MSIIKNRDNRNIKIRNSSMLHTRSTRSVQLRVNVTCLQWSVEKECLTVLKENGQALTLQRAPQMLKKLPWKAEKSLAAAATKNALLRTQEKLAL